MKTIEEFLSNLANLDIKLWVENVGENTLLEEVRLRCNSPKGALTPDIRAELAERKAEVINFLTLVTLKSTYLDETITPVPRNRDLPLSFAQARLWFLNQLEGESGNHSIPMSLRLFGSLNIPALEMAVIEIVQRHEALRTNFRLVNDSPVQVINSYNKISIPLIDLQHLSENEQSTEVEYLANKDFESPFDLSNGSLLRATLLRLGEQSHVLLLTTHHIVSDGWSMGVFVRELSVLYEAFCAGKPSPLPPLPIQYADFAYWQREWLSGDVLIKQLNYWKQQLAGVPPLLELPTDRPRPSVQTERGSFEEFELSQELTNKLKALSQESGVTLFMTLLAGFVTLLSRYSGQEDIVVGSLIANRNRSAIESLIGFFVNVLALRTELQGNPTFLELLERVQKMTLAAYDHQDLPFEKLVEELQPERSLSHAPLYQVMFVLQNASNQELELPGLTISPFEIGDVMAKDDLLLSMEETDTGLKGGLVYKSDLFDAATIQRMVAHFQNLLDSIVANPQQQIHQLPLLNPTEQNQLLLDWNQTTADYPLEQSFPQLFEAQVARTPDAVAVVFEDQQLTYQQLNTRANIWARHLVEQGVQAETIVALICDRNLDFLTAMLAVFKAGGAYLPLNPHHPPEHLHHVLSQSQVPLVLTSSCWASKVSPVVNDLDTPPQLLYLDPLDSLTKESENLPVRCNPDNLAYVIYTSGSTGQPKGAVLEHRGMLNHLYAKVTDLQLSANDVVAQTAAQTFDISIWQFLSALLVGGRVEIVRSETTADPAELISLIQRQQVSILEIVPSLLRMMLQHIEQDGNTKPNLPELRWILLTGETLPPQLCRQWFEYYPTIPMMNAYGPTECSDDVTHYPIYQPPEEAVLNLPIGRPISNTQLYILDTYLQPVPIGVAGELYVGGSGVGRGYLHNEQQTELAFIANPFNNSKLYKTGDKARYLPDGNIEFLGRIDYQVKIRGFRIELGEIEAVLRQNPQLQDAVVILSEDQPGNQHLVAYVVPNVEVSITSNQVRDFLKDKLPDYMVPSVVMLLEKMPLTPNGKIDRRSLPTPDIQSSLTANFVSPRNPTQEVIAGLWAEVLNLQQIGIYDNFFELGGHSLLATQIISRLRSLFKIDIPLRCLFESPTIAELSEFINATRHAGLGLIESTIEPIERNTDLPLSFGQTRLWFLDQLEGKTANYNIPVALRLIGSLNLVAMKMAVQEILARHEALRTTFKMVNGSPVQVIVNDTTANMSVIDLQYLPSVEQSAEVERLATEEIQHPFDLSNGPLLRVTLLQLDEQSHVLLMVTHHIVSDGWSMGIFVREFSALYQAFCEEESLKLPELPIQYADFANWQRQWLSGSVLQTQLDYWKKQLAGAPPLLELPLDRPRPSIQTFIGSGVEFQLNQDLTQKLSTLSQQSGTTLFMTLLSAFAILLSRYSGQEDIVVGSPIANRNRSETESLIGFFANTLVLRTQLIGNPTFRELLERVRETTLGAYDHQDLPFEKLVEELQPERSLSYAPLFQAMFMLQNASVEGGLELPGLTIAPLELESSGTTTDDLLLSIEETESGLAGEFAYNSVLFDATTITRMAGHFQTLLESIVANPQQPIASLLLLNTTEQHKLLVESNNTYANYPLEQCFPQLFEQQVVRTPDAIAVAFENQQLTYRQLNARANGWAKYLIEQGVGAETIIALLCERNIDFLTAILAIFKAGGAYLPLNPNHPVERIHQVLEQSQAHKVLATSQLSLIISQALNSQFGTAPQLLLLEQLPSSELADQDDKDENFPVRCSPDNLAYIIYTSGSTGKPKGAMLEHRGMLNHLYAKVTDLQLTATDVVAQTAPQSFDISVWQFLAALLVGGRVEIVRNEMVAPEQLLTLLQNAGISILEIVPSLLRMMLQHIQVSNQTIPNLFGLRWLLLTGETLPPQLCGQWFEYYPNIPMMNAYGPTECSDDVTHYPIYQPPAPQVLNLPIGRPISNTQLYILDSQLQPVPTGVAGELYVGGVGVGRGYLHNPTQTSAAFVENPFSEGSRLYKTGDKARFLADGNIEFLGRIDYQVKIRGFRIELGEIEAVLSQHPQVQEVVVIAREDQPGNQHIVAYVVTNEEMSGVSVLRNFLKEKLPDYMVPSAIVILEKMPLTPNGKVDRRALPAPDIQLSLTANFVAPRTPVQEILTKVWAEILNLKQVGIYDNFFEMGGHSLLATQVISRIRSLFEVDLPLRSLFESPTIAELSESISAMRHAGLGLQASAITPIPRNTDLPLSFAQARLWFLDQFEDNTATYNMPMTLQLMGSLNVTALEMAVQEIVRRHEALRTSFKMVNGSPVQLIASDANITISMIDLQHLTPVEQPSEAGRLATKEAQRPFDLSNGPLLRVNLLRLGEESHVLLLTVHHIVSDGWSMGIFIQELSEFYQTFCAGQPPQLPELPIQYADFAHWQREWLSGEILETQLNYWKQQLTGAPPLLELPIDRPRPSVQIFQSSSEEFQLDRELTQKLKTISQQSGTTLFMTLLAAYVTLLSRYTGQEDIVVGSPIANRNRNEIEPLIGFFVNMLVLRTQLHGNPTFLELLERVREMTLGAYDHQDLPFEKLVEELQPERSLSYTPLFQVMFMLEPASVEEMEMPGLSITSLGLESFTTTDDLLLSMEESEDGLAGGLTYNSTLFDASTIKRMVEHFQALLESIVTDPRQPVAQLAMLSAAERHQLLVEWNDSDTEYPLEQCFPQLFEQQAARTPEAIAVVFENQQLTYHELNARANRWARYLLEKGVGAETIVALFCERNIDFLTAILAVFKAGGAYLPLNPNHPSERIQQVLDQSQAHVVLATSQLEPIVSQALSNLDCTPQILLIQELANGECNSENLPVQCSPENLAYLIYTSGSTGKPKGAMLEHRGMLNHLYAKVTDLQLSEADVVAQTAPQSFDISVWQFLAVLLVGGRVEIVPNEMVAPAQLLTLVETQAISILEIVPSLLRMMLQHVELLGATQPQMSHLRWLLLTGETLAPQLCRQWFEYFPTIPMMNAYGPTECSDDVTHYPIYQPPAEGVLNLPIGRPVSNTQLYILDAQLQPLPIGVAGELYVGGVGVGRGYLHNPTQTSAVFVENPFAEGGRLYKTGDKARFLPDGNIEFLGRIDYQVKIRGFRIELGEIEAVLSQHPQVQETVVIAREDQPGKQYLVAYVIANEVMSGVNVLRNFLKEKLPDYMVPSAIVILEKMPLTPNGKIDRRALPAPGKEYLNQLSLNASFAPPRDNLELQLTQIWEEVLNIHPIGIRDNFFDLGGHSLLAISLIAKIQSSFGKNLSLAAFFQGATIESLANILRSSTVPPSWSTLVTIQSGSSSKQPFFCIHPGAGTVLAYVDLAHHLGSEQPFYGLESLGLEDEQKPYGRVEEIAAHYIEAMQTVQPQGPYRLGGWSFGGLVAFEMAQQLHAQGQQVSLLALLDTSAVMDSEESQEQDEQEYNAFLEELLVSDNSSILGLPPELDKAQTQRLVNIFKSHILAGNSYQTQPYQGKVTLFLAEEGLAVESEEATLGWKNLASEGVDIHWIPGDHLTLVSKPNVEILAQKLRLCLDNHSCE
ncbi:MAG: amino acid adenylation domain-containing protein [Scytonematopsis contorta HA4267-MV1]|jgi:amino acid adenylation domain-containing protein|nr:amino acid adenylation domain-containing protein [Scytonematopsis contorta HA4267-MV1]